MKKILFCLAATGLTVGMGTLARAQDNPPPQPRERTPSLTVTGHGEVNGAPDRAIVRLGAEASGQEAIAAQNSLNATLQKALAAIRAVGIDDRNIQTTGMNLYPVYANNPPSNEPIPPRITGYRASNTLQVIVNNLTLVGRVIDAAIGAGANQLQGISFDLQNDLPQRTSALQQAAQEARSKADTIAKALGVRITGIAEINESGVNVIPPQPIPMYSAMRAQSMVATPVQPGELRVQAMVTVRYNIAPGT